VSVLETVPVASAAGPLLLSGGSDNYVHLMDARQNLKPINTWYKGSFNVCHVISYHVH
jgi:hypothetical protein